MTAAPRPLILCAGSEGLVTIACAAERHRISKNHLMKIANQLVRAGFLEAVRGRNGGLKLARAAAEINIGEVVRLLEGDTVLVECFAPRTNSCVIVRHCGLKPLLAEAVEDFYRRLDGASLADITPRRRMPSA
ncbi:MAG: Rrf2 family transcriptional regulator [Hyphomicrobiales bacterium]